MTGTHRQEQGGSLPEVPNLIPLSQGDCFSPIMGLPHSHITGDWHDRPATRDRLTYADLLIKVWKISAAGLPHSHIPGDWHDRPATRDRITYADLLIKVWQTSSGNSRSPKSTMEYHSPWPASCNHLEAVAIWGWHLMHHMLAMRSYGLAQILSLTALYKGM